jgi:hypothetical protein
MKSKRRKHPEEASQKYWCSFRRRQTMITGDSTLRGSNLRPLAGDYESVKILGKALQNLLSQGTFSM